MLRETEVFKFTFSNDSHMCAGKVIKRNDNEKKARQQDFFLQYKQ